MWRSSKSFRRHSLRDHTKASTTSAPGFVAEKKRQHLELATSVRCFLYCSRRCWCSYSARDVSLASRQRQSRPVGSEWGAWASASLACVAVVALVTFTTPELQARVRSATPAVGTPALAWQDCGDGFQCATLKAPLDYRHRNATQIDIALVRRPAESPAIRIGSLVTNPGGPGLSGIDELRRTATGYPPEVRARFDLVSFDPRGVGA